MIDILTTLVLASALVASTVALNGFALAGSDAAYHWAYPDNLKSSPNIPTHSLGVESGIPAQYR